MKSLKYAYMTVVLLALAACGQVPAPEAAPTEVPAEAPTEAVVEAPNIELRTLATVTGITGGYKNASGATFAKQGDSLVLNLSMVTDKTKCVFIEDVSGSTAVLLGAVWANNTPTTYSFTFTAGAGDGVRRLRATPMDKILSKYPGTNTNVPSAGQDARNLCNGDNHELVATASYTQDNTVPTITGSHAAAPGKPAAQNDWYRDDVVVSFECSDSGSGIKSCTPAETLTGEGANITRTGTATDNVGKTKNATVSGINIDRSAPLTTADAPSGWQNNGVTVTLSASDNLSTVAKTEYSLNNGTWTTGTSIPLGEGRHTLKYRSTDRAGNVEAEKTAVVEIDMTAPTIESSQDPAKNGEGWNKQNSVTVSFICGDSLSGVASCTDAQTVTAEGTTYVSGDAVDNTQNSNTISHPVSIDRTAPSISGSQSPAKNASGWNNTDVTVNFTCDDDRSGVVSCPASESFGQGAGQSVTRSVSDRADNSASTTVSGINVDKAAPTTSSNAPSGWQNNDFNLVFTANDQPGLSGVDFTEYSQDGGRTWTSGNSVNLGEGSRTVLYRSVDNAGNVEQHETATVTVDKTAPVVTISGPASTSDTSATVTGTASDSGSGVASLTVNGSLVTLTDGSYSTSVALECGSNTVTATATDGVERTGSETVTISRTCTVVQPPAASVWTSQGFFAPVDMNTSTKKFVNTVKGGSTVPLKFRIYKDGVEVKDTTATTFKVSATSCDAGASTDAIEVVTSGSTSLRYDGSQWIQNWKTPTALGCYTVFVALPDGAPPITADFRILK